MDWSIKLDQVLEQEVLRKGKPNKLGFGSYKADNTELIRPYQQESSSPIGRGYPMGIVSGAPTVFDPSAGVQDDPVVALLKQLLGQKPVVHKAPDAGFKSNDQVYTTSEPSLELPGRTLGAAPADRGLGGGGGGDVVYPNIDVKEETSKMNQPTPIQLNIPDITSEQRSMLNTIVARLGEIVGRGGAAITAGATFGAAQMTNMRLPMTPRMFTDATLRQIEESFRGYVPSGTAETLISGSRNIIDLITRMDRYREDIVRLGERAISDNVYRPVQVAANRGLQMLLTSARDQLDSYGEITVPTITQIVQTIMNNPVHATGAVTMQAVILIVTAVLAPGALMRAQGRLRANPAQRAMHNVAAF